MGENLGTASLELVADGKKLGADLDKWEKEAGQSAQRGGAAFGSFGSAVTKATLPATAALGLVAVGVKRTTDAASDLGESANAVGVVFGDAGGKIRAFSKIADEEAGLSMRAFNELVTPIGASLQNVGFSADEAADASINLGKRAADMASVFNVDVATAMEAIQAGLRGEADPLEKFGVGLSDAAVTAKALKMGLGDAKGEVDASGKAHARLALIMEQSSKVAGDFKNTSDSLANSQRINAAQSENMQAKIGQGLLPVMQTFQGVLGAVTGLMSEHTTAVTVAAGVIGGLAAGVLAIGAGMKIYQAGAVAVTAAQWLWNAALTANPIGIIIVGLVALGAALVIAYQKSQTFRDIVHGALDVARLAFDKVKTAAGAVADFLSGPLSVAVGAAKVYIAGWKVALGLAEDALGFLKSAGGKVADFLGGAWGVAVGIAKTAAAGFETAVDLARGAINSLKSAGSTLASWFEAGWNTAVGIAKTAASGLDTALDAVKTVLGGIKSAGTALVKFLGDAWGTAWSAASTALSPIKTMLDSISSVLGGIADAARTAASAIGRVADVARGIGGVVGKLPGLAAGGTIQQAGLAIVGERGPELLALPRGAAVYPDLPALPRLEPMSFTATDPVSRARGSRDARPIIVNFNEMVIGDERRLTAVVAQAVRHAIREGRL